MDALEKARLACTNAHERATIGKLALSRIRTLGHIDGCERDNSRSVIEAGCPCAACIASCALFHIGGGDSFSETGTPETHRLQQDRQELVEAIEGLIGVLTGMANFKVISRAVFDKEEVKAAKTAIYNATA